MIIICDFYPRFQQASNRLTGSTEPLESSAFPKASRIPSLPLQNSARMKPDGSLVFGLCLLHAQSPVTEDCIE